MTRKFRTVREIVKFYMPRYYAERYEPEDGQALAERLIEEFKVRLRKEDMETQYTITYICGNCWHESKESYPRGTRAPSTITCERCGCHSAHKHWPRRLLTGHTSTSGKWKCANHSMAWKDVARAIEQFVEGRTQC